MVPQERRDVTGVRPHVFLALDGQQPQGSVSFLDAPGFEPRRAVPVVGDHLRHAVVRADDAGRVGSGEGPGEREVLQVPGASAGDGDVLTLSRVYFHPGGERVELRHERDVVLN